MRGGYDINKRIQWVDYAKGISIILVVLHHAISRNLNEPFYSENLIVLNDTLKLFRMPLFFFLSGLFISRSFKFDIKGFFHKRIKNLLFVYTLWNLMWYAFVIIFASSFLLKKPFDFGWILSLYYDPPIYWFLFALIIFSSVTYLFRGKVWFVFILSLVGFSISISNGNHHSPTFLDEILRYYPMYLCGYYFSKNLIINSNKIKKRYSILLPVYLVIVGWVLNSSVSSLSLVVFPLMLIGILLGVSLSKAMEGIKQANYIAYIGRNTLPIYLMHVYPKLGLTVLFSYIGLESAIIFTIIQFAAGLILPILFLKLTEKTPINIIFNIDEVEKYRLKDAKVA